MCEHNSLVNFVCLLCSGAYAPPIARESEVIYTVGKMQSAFDAKYRKENLYAAHIVNLSKNTHIYLGSTMLLSLQKNFLFALSKMGQYSRYDHFNCYSRRPNFIKMHTQPFLGNFFYSRVCVDVPINGILYLFCVGM